VLLASNLLVVACPPPSLELHCRYLILHSRRCVALYRYERQEVDGKCREHTSIEVEGNDGGGEEGDTRSVWIKCKCTARGGRAGADVVPPVVVVVVVVCVQGWERGESSTTVEMMPCLLFNRSHHTC
jgi:hypothetical protein